MNDEGKTKQQLVTELEELRRRVKKAEEIDVKCKRLDKRPTGNIDNETILTSIITLLSECGDEDIDDKIDQSLGLIGKLLGVDRSFIFVFTDETKQKIYESHDWCKEAVESNRAKFRNIQVQALPWVMKKLNSLENIIVHRLEDMPPEAHIEKQLIKSSGAKSVILVPMIHAQALYGFLGISSAKSGMPGLEEDTIPVLRATATVFMNSFERKHAYDLLRHRSEELDTLFDTTPVPQVVIDTKERIHYANRAALDFTGSTMANIIGKKIGEVLHCKNYIESNQECGYTPHCWDCDIRNSILNTIQTKKRTQGLETEIVQRHGEEWSTRTILVNSGYLDNKPDAKVIISLEDITGRKLSNESLSESEERFKTLSNLSPAGIYLTDLQGKCIYVNERWSEMSGLSSEQAKGDGWMMGLHPQDREKVITEWKKTIESKSDWRLEYRFRTPEGKTTWVYGLVTRMLNNVGDVIGFVGVNVDITGRKETESNQRLLNSLLEILNQPGDKKSKIRNVLQTIQEFTGFEAVGIRLNDGEDYPYFETSGFTSEFVEKESRLCIYNSEGEAIRDSKGAPLLECMCGNVISGRMDPDRPFFTAGGSFWTNSTTELLASTSDKEQRRARTRNRCNRAGYESVGLIPLRSDNAIIGLLQLNDCRKNMFTPVLVRFLESIGVSIGIALAREEAASALLASAKQWWSTFDAINEAVFLLNMEGTITQCNRATIKLLGKPRNEIIGSTCFELVHGNSGHIIGCPFELMKTSRKRETLILNTEGDNWLEISADPVMDSDGKITGAVHTISDITNRKRAEEAVRKTEALYRDLVETSQDLIWRCNAEGQFTFLNGAWEKTHGYTIDEMLGRSFTEFQSPDAASRDLQEFRRLIAGGSVSGYETVHLTKSGERIHLLFNARPLYDNDGQIIGTQGTAHDITDRKAAQKILEEQKSLLDEIFNNINEGIGIVDKDENIIFCNPAYAEIFDSDPETVVGKNLMDILDGEAVSIIRRQTEVRRKGKRSTYEIPFTSSKGYVKHLLITTSPRYDADGIYIGAFGAVLDITNRKRAEEELKKHRDNLEELIKERTAEVTASNEKLKLEIADRTRAESELAAEKELLDITMRNVGDGVITTDNDGTIIMINTAAANLTGWPVEDATGKSLDEVFTIVVKQKEAGSELVIDEKGHPGDSPSLPHDVFLIARDGTERIISYSISPVRDKNDEITGSVLAFHDITRKQKLEEEFSRSGKLESVGILAGGIAHDFNNILTAILANISAAKLHVKPDDILYQILLDTERASTRARNLTQQLLTFSRGGAPIKKAVSLVELLEENAEFALSGSNVKCVYEIADDLWPADIDVGQISQVIHNLTINAAQAMPEGGIVTIKSENITLEQGNTLPLKEGKYIRISIRDEGTGIPEANLEKIFDPYFTTKEEGSGLGLATTYSIIKQHNGHISLESRVGAGTTFYIYLPASGADVVDKTIEEKSPGNGGGKLLLMDDDESIRESVGELLRFFGYEVELAHDGVHALELYRGARESEKPFDAIIMDLTIPGGMGGKETIQRLLEIDPGVKAIVSSGYSNDPIMADHKKHGFSAVVAKPYNIEELRSTLSRVINNGNK